MYNDILEKVTIESEEACEIIRNKGTFYLTENYCPNDFIEFDKNVCELFDINLQREICPKCWLKQV